MAFLLSEFTWRRRIPALFPYGHLDRRGVLRLPIAARLGATVVLTALAPSIVLLTLVVGVGEELGPRLPASIEPIWRRFVWADVYVVVTSGAAATAMALLVARFINRPVQALRLAMTRVVAGEFGVRVPVRSLDELGELNEHFNSMVAELERGARSRELFGRYVSPRRSRRPSSTAASSSRARWSWPPPCSPTCRLAARPLQVGEAGPALPGSARRCRSRRTR